MRDVLVRVADAGVVELDEPGNGGPAAPDITSGIALSMRPPDPEDCASRGRLDVLAGEEELQARVDQAITEGDVAGLAGWIAADQLTPLADQLSELGAAVAPLPRPRGIDPPTKLRETGVSHGFDPLVRTYATLPYNDVNPSIVAGLAYVVMFGMMFADAGHGAVLVLGAVLVRPAVDRLKALPGVAVPGRRGRRQHRVRGLYGEFFGPTGVVPTLARRRWTTPVQLLVAAIASGRCCSPVPMPSEVNRWREGGWRGPCTRVGLAGAGLFFGLGLVAAGWYTGPGGPARRRRGRRRPRARLRRAARRGGRRRLRRIQAGIELFDIVVRLGSNLVSFARLAAFGFTHAALGFVMWGATTGLWGTACRRGRRGPGLPRRQHDGVRARGSRRRVQALRLEYYELFSRIFQGEGRPFRPWHVPLATTEDSC